MGEIRIAFGAKKIKDEQTHTTAKGERNANHEHSICRLLLRRRSVVMAPGEGTGW